MVWKPLIRFTGNKELSIMLAYSSHCFLSQFKLFLFQETLVGSF